MDAKFDHEKLKVYKLELEFVAWTGTLLQEVRKEHKAYAREICDHLDRGSLSALLNTAEGNGKRQGRSRAKFFDDARGSSMECAACLDAFVARGISTVQRVRDGKSMLFGIVSMLSRLIQIQSDGGGVREDEEEYLSDLSHCRSIEEEEKKEEENDVGQTRPNH